MPYRVFISYCRDNVAQRAAIAARLESIPDIEVYYDTRVVEPGNSIHSEISSRIEECDALVVILTQEGARSLEVREEVVRADERNKRIIPIVEANVEDQDLPWFLREVLQLRFSTRDFDNIFVELTELVENQVTPRSRGINRGDASSDSVFNSALSLFDSGKALAVASHWDDLLLGCLGTLVKLRFVYDFDVHILVFCNSHNRSYYGVQQDNIDGRVSSMYERLCEECGFTYIQNRSNNDLLVDRELRRKYHAMRGILDEIVNDNEKSPFNLVLCPPIDDEYEDHAVVGELTFSTFRQPDQVVLEYLIKRYTERPFVPNICISLDERVKLRGATRSIAEEKIRLIRKVCDINNSTIPNSSRFFSEEALRARAMVNALDYAKNRAMNYSEIFRGRFEL